MKRALSFILLAAFAMSAAGARAEILPSEQAYDLFFKSDHSLVPTVPVARSRAQDSLAPTPGGPLVPFQVFRTTDPLETVLAAQHVNAEEITNGSVLLYIRYLRSKRKLNRCLDFQVTVQGDASGTEIAKTSLQKASLNPGFNSIALPFRFDDAARTTTLKTERLRLTVLVGIDATCSPATLKLVFDNKGRPSHMTVSTCTAPEGSPDLNHNGLADVCETQVVADTDGDGVPDEIDDCPNAANPDQADADHDGVGDACDAPDGDGDGMPDAIDNCPAAFNPDQADANHNGVGDACEQAVAPAADVDGDSVADAHDNCPNVPNPDQADLNHNGVGDACECNLGAPGRCLAGGGARRTDCLVEFNTPGPVLYTRNLRRVRNLLRCHDGDPACDRDATVDGKCTFMVSICVANRDPRFPRCAASDLAKLEVMRPRGLQNAARLEGVASALGLEVVRKGQVVTPGLAFKGKDVCSPISELTIPAPVTLHGRVRQRFAVRAQAMNGKLDTDHLTLECLAR
ncbi:MAG TPA: thrombospondin type 3 repeat-containing protein [Candidatus Binatia bacterium]|nr:thrombospondin type 3 repeat-containing protein [Candidatus Binatia bacterium]